MRRIYVEKLIEASPEAVWAVLTDIAQYEAWNPFVVKAEGVIQEGRSFRAYIRLPDGWVSKYRRKTLRLKPAREWTWLGRFLNIPGLGDGEHSFQLVAEGNKTRFIQKEHFTGILVPLFWRDAWVGRLAALAPVHPLIRSVGKLFAPTAEERNGWEVSP